jgi:FixJ family two-component response regulator
VNPLFYPALHFAYPVLQRGLTSALPAALNSLGGVGLEAAQIASKKRVPVIITSGHRHIFERVKKAGYFYLMKPFTISELLDMASAALGQELGSFEYPSIQIH